MATTHFNGPVQSANGFIGDFTGGITGGSTAAEINARTDDSAMADTFSGAGAIPVGTAYTAVTSTGANALTLAVPTKPAFLKVIKMVVDGGDATLALTNVVSTGGSTTCTFNDVGDTIVLCSDTVGGKWILMTNIGCTLA